MDRLKQVELGSLEELSEELKTAFTVIHWAHEIYDLKTKMSYKDPEPHWKDLYTLLQYTTQQVRHFTPENKLFCKDLAVYLSWFLLHLIGKNIMRLIIG